MSNTTDKIDVRSPCVGVCALDADDICIGCYRSGSEITEWGVMSNDERRQVLVKVTERERDSGNFIPVG